jgi:hypothetical protein
MGAKYWLENHDDYRIGDAVFKFLGIGRDLSSHGTSTTTGLLHQSCMIDDDE